MSNYGAKPTGSSSAAAIVRFGLTRAQRLKVAARDDATMRTLSRIYSGSVVAQLCDLCDSYAASEGAAWGGAA